jgi:hypothetical protein
VPDFAVMMTAVSAPGSACPVGAGGGAAGATGSPATVTFAVCDSSNGM